MISPTVLVCQGKACRKAGSLEILAAFQAAHLEISVVGCHCLGQCGNGPMILVLPEQVWYHQVHLGKVPTIGQQHLQNGQRVTAWLYPKFH
ncbi:MAG: (2Fe-2S) ferredoxin domain-containing protein [Elainella sp. Prado103]|nr:(2Fe-2S) ferredoxin domain-containing protein [Elainella sp. Prado103]